MKKNSPRLEAYGTVDELNSHIGLLRSMLMAGRDDGLLELDAELELIQNTLFDMGTILATEQTSAWQPPQPDPKKVQALESAIDRMDAQLPPLRQFILPAGTPASAQAHVARTVARRAERRTIDVADSEPEAINPIVIKYLNRLSDYLFALARVLNLNSGHSETFWSPNK